MAGAVHAAPPGILAGGWMAECFLRASRGRGNDKASPQRTNSVEVWLHLVAGGGNGQSSWPPKGRFAESWGCPGSPCFLPTTPFPARMLSYKLAEWFSYLTALIDTLRHSSNSFVQFSHLKNDFNCFIILSAWVFCLHVLSTIAVSQLHTLISPGDSPTIHS